MRVISVNIGNKKTIEWEGRIVETGIYKYPVDHSISLMKEDVLGDHVIDRRYHGGVDKACYLYSANNYSYWKKLYPDLDWQWGMFGENLTVEGLNEAEINIGDEYQIGETIVQFTQPRQPCFKLGIRFNSKEMVKQFWEAPYPGVYIRVLKEGQVKAHDELILINKNEKGMSLANVFSLFTSNRKNISMLETAIEMDLLADSCRNDLFKLRRMLL